MHHGSILSCALLGCVCSVGPSVLQLLRIKWSWPAPQKTKLPKVYEPIGMCAKREGFHLFLSLNALYWSGHLDSLTVLLSNWYLLQS